MSRITKSERRTLVGKFKKRIYAGETIKDIANDLGVAQGTAYSWARRGLIPKTNRLRKRKVSNPIVGQSKPIPGQVVITGSADEISKLFRFMQ